MSLAATLIAAGTLLVRAGFTWADGRWEDLCRNDAAMRDAGAKDDEKTQRSLVLDHLCQYGPDKIKEKLYPISCNTRRAFDYLCTEIDKSLNLLAVAAARNRYTMTLLFTSAYQFFLEFAEGKGNQNPSNCIPWLQFHRTAERAIDWLTGLQGELAPLSQPRKEDVVIGRSLALLDELHDSPLPLATRQAALPDGLARHQRRLVDIQTQLLWHLAVIGQPVEAEVLARCPLVRQAILAERRGAAGASSPKGGPATEAEAREREERAILCDVERTLLVLEARCLVFRMHRRDRVLEETNKSETGGGPAVQPVPGDYQQTMADTGGPRIRWAVHRLVQRHFFHKMEAPFVENPKHDRFGLSVYCSQPDGLPHLTPDVHRQLHGTISALIAYPDGPPIPQPPPFLPRDPGDTQDGMLPAEAQARFHADHATAVECLRAALGIVRSAYSVSVLSRLQGPGHNEDPVWAPRGWVEEHRLLLRWMVRQALWLEDCWEDFPHVPKRDAAKSDDAPRAFYAEEIAWLHNEAGVLSLTQGRIGDSIALLERANSAARQMLEPSESGSIRTRIALNRALADIERGQLSLARETLDRIWRNTREKDDIRLMARGFLGVVEHIAGRIEPALQCYDQALHGVPDGEGGTPPGMDGLIALRRSRAAALFSRSLGDLYRRADRLEPQKALKALNQAFTLALEGGHHDVSQSIALSRLHAEMSAEEAAQKPMIAARLAERHRQLDRLEEYARRAGLLRLHSEVDIIRSRLHRESGDLPAAGAAAARSLAITAANDLVLRKTGLLLELAQVQLAREMHGDSRVLLHAALASAQHGNYHAAFMEAQGLLSKVTGRSD